MLARGAFSLHLHDRVPSFETRGRGSSLETALNPTGRRFLDGAASRTDEKHGRLTRGMLMLADYISALRRETMEEACLLQELQGPINLRRCVAVLDTRRAPPALVGASA